MLEPESPAGLAVPAYPMPGHSARGTFTVFQQALALPQLSDPSLLASQGHTFNFKGNENSVGPEGSLVPFYRCENEGSTNLSSLPKAAQLGKGIEPDSDAEVALLSLCASH